MPRDDRGLGLVSVELAEEANLESERQGNTMPVEVGRAKIASNTKRQQSTLAKYTLTTHAKPISQYQVNQ